MKVLLMEDSPTVRALILAYLKPWGYEVIQASDGPSALALFDQHDPDLLLLDVLVPGLNGFEVARRIRTLRDDWRPIIFLTSRGSDDEVATGMAAGGDDYLVKPVSPIVLRAKMNAMERIRAIQSNLLNTREQLRRTVERLELAAHVDGLTDLPNRRRLDAKLHEELLRSKRAEKPFSVILMDIDRFKSYNDALGHLAGDDCLKKVSGALARGIVRAGDLVGRFGGEEFTAVLPATPLPGAVVVAERLRASIEDLALPHPSGGLVTVSCGVSACCSQRANVAELLTTADAALYQAKAAGRNLVCARPLSYD